jgi:poly(3-hydroxybutyrate) depolymerase
MQLASFYGMHLGTHISAQFDLFQHLVEGDHEKAERLIAFYNEYCSVSDLARPFYLQTVDQVFKRQVLANGTMEHRGIRIDPAAITRTDVFTIEAKNDDISAPGQTVAAQAWLTGLKPEQQYHHLQEGIGHYGIFNGSVWSKEIAPRLISFIRRKPNNYDPVPATSSIIKPELWQPA